jgi:Amt family ammonium transporter
MVRDITERKRFEEELAAEKNSLAVTLASIGDGVITTDSTGRS